MNSHHEPPARTRLHAPRAWLLGVLLALQATLAQAQGPADAPGACDVTVTGQSIDAALATLRGLERQCHKHAPFLYRLGRLLNQAGQYEAAIDPLEGAILYAPDHWPSQLEYAIALEGIGDHESALNLIQALLQQPEVDPAVKQQLLALQSRPAQARRPAARRVFSLATGYDSNLLGSTYHTEFTLTTPDGPLPVALLQDQRPRAGAFARAELSVDGLLVSTDQTLLRYSLAGSYRANPGLASANRLQVAAFVEASATGGKGPYLLAQHQTLLINETAMLRQNQFGMGYDLPLGAAGGCQQRLGLDLQHLAYPGNTVLGGRYLHRLVSIYHLPRAGGAGIAAQRAKTGPADQPPRRRPTAGQPAPGSKRPGGGRQPGAGVGRPPAAVRPGWLQCVAGQQCPAPDQTAWATGSNTAGSAAHSAPTSGWSGWSSVPTCGCSNSKTG